jgi:hypothetical protein
MPQMPGIDYLRYRRAGLTSMRQWSQFLLLISGLFLQASVLGAVVGVNWQEYAPHFDKIPRSDVRRTNR